MSQYRSAYENGLITNADIVGKFEAAVAERLQVKHCVAVSSCTSGLMMSLRGLGVTGEVIIPSFTFFATGHSARWNGLTPVFADCDPDTWNVDVNDVERKITERTRALLIVHLYGNPANVEALTEDRPEAQSETHLRRRPRLRQPVSRQAHRQLRRRRSLLALADQAPGRRRRRPRHHERRLARKGDSPDAQLRRQRFIRSRLDRHERPHVGIQRRARPHRSRRSRRPRSPPQSDRAHVRRAARESARACASRRSIIAT